MTEARWYTEPRSYLSVLTEARWYTEPRSILGTPRRGRDEPRCTLPGYTLYCTPLPVYPALYRSCRTGKEALPPWRGFPGLTLDSATPRLFYD